MILRHNDSGSQSLLRASIESSKLWFIFGKTHRATMDVSDTLPDDIDALRALLLAERANRAAIVAERDKLVVRNERLEAIISEIRRAYFGRKSERITDDQLSLALQELGPKQRSFSIRWNVPRYERLSEASSCRRTSRTTRRRNTSSESPRSQAANAISSKPAIENQMIAYRM
jgi:hypothetical protein